MNFGKFLIFFNLMLSPVFSWAGGLEELDVFLKSINSGTLNYSQTVYKKKFDGTPRSSESKARLEFSRPHSFRIEYEPPNEYIFSANGKTLTRHDPELKTTTSEDQTSLMDKEFLALLEARSIQSIQSKYDFREISENGFDWAIITPKSNTKSIFQKISLGFQRNELTRIETLDFGGDRIVYKISWESLEPPDPSRFSYSPPAGADYEDKTTDPKSPTAPTPQN